MYGETFFGRHTAQHELSLFLHLSSINPCSSKISNVGLKMMERAGGGPQKSWPGWNTGEKGNNFDISRTLFRVCFAILYSSIGTWLISKRPTLRLEGDIQPFIHRRYLQVYSYFALPFRAPLFYFCMLRRTLWEGIVIGKTRFSWLYLLQQVHYARHDELQKYEQIFKYWNYRTF